MKHKLRLLLENRYIELPRVYSRILARDAYLRVKTILYLNFIILMKPRLTSEPDGKFLVVGGTL